MCTYVYLCENIWTGFEMSHTLKNRRGSLHQKITPDTKQLFFRSGSVWNFCIFDAFSPGEKSSPAKLINDHMSCQHQKSLHYLKRYFPVSKWLHRVLVFFGYWVVATLPHNFHQWLAWEKIFLIDWFFCLNSSLVLLKTCDSWHCVTTLVTSVQCAFFFWMEVFTKLYLLCEVYSYVYYYTPLHNWVEVLVEGGYKDPRE